MSDSVKIKSKLIIDQKYFDYFLIVISVILGLYLNWEILDITLFSFIIWQIIRPLSRKNLNVNAFFLLFLALILLFLKKGQWAEDVSFLAFCSLITVVIMAAIQTFSKGELSDK